MASAVYVANWIGNSIPNMSRMRDELSEGMNFAGRKMKDVEREKAEVEWTSAREAVWAEFKQAISDAAKKNLHSYSHKRELVLMSDASGKYWSACLGQCDVGASEKELQDLVIDPIMFFSGSFGKNQMKWHISSKELFPLLYVADRVNFLLAGSLTFKDWSGGV